MTEQTLLILVSLIGGERHGYGIAQQVERLSEGRARLTAGTLYGALNRLSDAGHVAETGEQVVDGRRRRYYRITAEGQRAAEVELARLRSLVSAVSSSFSTQLGSAGLA